MRKPYELMQLMFETVYTKSGDDVDYAVVIKEKERSIYLIFQQSASKRDWQNNFNFPVKPYKNQESCLMVARGWGKAYKSCNDEIMQKLICAWDSRRLYDIVITGWSYGGAMAILAAEDFFHRTLRKPKLITFGAPKPIFGMRTLRYVLLCVQDCKQYVNRNDVVPLLPPFPGYKQLNKIKVGEKFNFFKLFNPAKYHCKYDKKELYE